MSWRFSLKFNVTASRGVACVFAARKRALVYILEEDEDEATDAEWLMFFLIIFSFMGFNRG